MRIVLSGNCQCSGIATFLRLAPNAASYRISEIPHLVQFYQGIDPKAHPELPAEEQERMMREADVILYHAKGGHEPDLLHLNDTAIKIPLSVVYNSAYFIMCWEEKTNWAPVLDFARANGIDAAVRYAVREHDFGYEERWWHDFSKMMLKEVNEDVPEFTKISPFFHCCNKHQQPLITNNHPTSILFCFWTNCILAHLGEQTMPASMDERARANPNMAGLPCEFSAGSGARKHLGLSWGARPEDEQSCSQIARERITTWMKE